MSLAYSRWWSLSCSVTSSFCNQGNGDLERAGPHLRQITTFPPLDLLLAAGNHSSAKCGWGKYEPMNHLSYFIRGNEWKGVPSASWDRMLCWHQVGLLDCTWVTAAEPGCWQVTAWTADGGLGGHSRSAASRIQDEGKSSREWPGSGQLTEHFKNYSCLRQPWDD